MAVTYLVGLLGFIHFETVLSFSPHHQTGYFCVFVSVVQIFCNKNRKHSEMLKKDLFSEGCPVFFFFLMGTEDV